MTEKDFLEFFDLIDENILKLIIDDSYKQGQKHYNNLILEGWSQDEALYDVIMKTSYRTLKYAVMTALYFSSNIDPERPKTKEELKKLFKVIKQSPS